MRLLLPAIVRHHVCIRLRAVAGSSGGCLVAVPRADLKFHWREVWRVKLIFLPPLALSAAVRADPGSNPLISCKTQQERCPPRPRGLRPLRCLARSPRNVARFVHAQGQTLSGSASF